jgi:hypothetical protein
VNLTRDSRTSPTGEAREFTRSKLECKRRAPSGQEARRRQRGDWRGNLADQAIGRIEARLVLLLLSKIVIPVK